MPHTQQQLNEAIAKCAKCTKIRTRQKLRGQLAINVCQKHYSMAYAMAKHEVEMEEKLAKV